MLDKAKENEYVIQQARSSNVGQFSRTGPGTMQGQQPHGPVYLRQHPSNGERVRSGRIVHVQNRGAFRAAERPQFRDGRAVIVPNLALGISHSRGATPA